MSTAGDYPPHRGGVARQLKRSWRAGREARARAKRKRDSAQPQEKHEASREVRQNRENAGLTTPSAPLWWLRGIFFVAHSPPQRGGECAWLAPRFGFAWSWQ